MVRPAGRDSATERVFCISVWCTAVAQQLLTMRVQGRQRGVCLPLVSSLHLYFAAICTPSSSTTHLCVFTSVQHDPGFSAPHPRGLLFAVCLSCPPGSRAGDMKTLTTRQLVVVRPHSILFSDSGRLLDVVWLSSAIISARPQACCLVDTYRTYRINMYVLPT